MNKCKGKSSATKARNFFRDYARKKWRLKGSKRVDNLMTQIIGVRFRVSGRWVA